MAARRGGGGGELQAEEAERVRAALRELLERHNGNKAKLGEKLGVTGQSLSQSLRADRPTAPSLDTARRVARELGLGSRVWLLLWPQSGTEKPMSNFDLAAEVARREGWADAAIEEIARSAAFNPDAHSPMHWLTRIQGRHLELDTTPANEQNPPRKRVREPDLVPGKILSSFAERLRYARELRGWSVDQLADRSSPRVTPGDIRMLEDGKTLGRSEASAVDRLRAALMIDAGWFGSPAADAAAASTKKRRGA